jgi:hypothetical protein
MFVASLNRRSDAGRRIPDSLETEALEMFHICGSEFGHSVVSQSQGQAGVDRLSEPTLSL